ncbi:MAG: D-sedoheptulose-7-phosphate isomerase [Promethearchaeota archaeon]
MSLDKDKISQEVVERLDESIKVKESMKDMKNEISDVVQMIIEAFKKDKKVILFGNGGSAADAQHITAEFIGKFFKNRKSLPAIALTTNSSIVTALANDFGYETVFKRQLEGLMDKDDVVIGISTSGNSPNVVIALEYAKQKGGKTVAFVGKKKCKLDDIADIVLKVPSESTPRIQEGHITLGHIICELVEKELFD